MSLGIYYLKLTQAAIRTGSKIHDHYILMSKNRFFVLTSNPIKNMKSHYIHDHNIKGENKSQYVILHKHYYDPSKHIITTKIEGMQYFIKHKEKFKPVLKMIEKNE